MTAYASLLSLRVEHDFYADGVCRGLTFEPTADTSLRLRRADCVLRPLDGGVEVFADAQRIGAFISGDDEPFELGFWVRSTDASFAAVTAGISQVGDAAIVFSQAQPDDVGAGWRLQAGPPQSPEDLELLGSPRPRPRGSAAFGVHVVIDSTEPKRCHLRLASRALPWKYYFVGEWESDGLYVADPDAEVEFSELAPEQLPNGREVLSALSAAPIALAERADQRFQLRRRTGNGDKLIVKRLPVAAAGQWGLQLLHSGRALVSEIYVNR